VGGLKATFLTDYLHTLIALILMIYFTIATLTNENIGGIHGLYDKIVANAHRVHIPGNFEGSLITFKSKPAILWGLILRMCNLSLVVMVRNYSMLKTTALTTITQDTAFWQKSFATNIHASHFPYISAAVDNIGN
jgi:Na+/proline symporter